MPRSDRDRIDQLARRVGWLDRRRRPLALLGAAIASPLLLWQRDDVLDAEWPTVHELAVTLMVGVLLWIAIEIGLAWLIAIWETEQHQLLREGALPRARLRKARLRARLFARVGRLRK
jgi:hypothetical protein